MTEKRYAIVRVDNSCPAMSDGFGCIVARNMLHCKCGEDTKNYGDTKEQLVRKIQVALKREKIKQGLTYYWLARKIVEFLGAE